MNHTEMQAFSNKNNSVRFGVPYNAIDLVICSSTNLGSHEAYQRHTFATMVESETSLFPYSIAKLGCWSPPQDCQSLQDYNRNPSQTFSYQTFCNWVSHNAALIMLGLILQWRRVLRTELYSQYHNRRMIWKCHGLYLVTCNAVEHHCTYTTVTTMI